MNINHNIETVAEIFFQAQDNISSFKGCIEMAETLKEENPKEFYKLLAEHTMEALESDDEVAIWIAELLMKLDDNSLLKEKTNENL
jgi:lipoate synthase